MATFTPPTIAEVPPYGAEDQNPLGALLMRFYKSRQRGVAVFKLTDGTYRVARQVPGLNVAVLEPWPPVPEVSRGGDAGVVNDAIAWSWVYEKGTKYPLPNPVQIVYYGGHKYTVSSAEAAALTSAGFGSYLT